jgi:hypothetical protein
MYIQDTYIIRLPAISSADYTQLTHVTECSNVYLFCEDLYQWKVAMPNATFTTDCILPDNTTSEPSFVTTDHKSATEASSEYITVTTELGSTAKGDDMKLLIAVGSIIVCATFLVPVMILLVKRLHNKVMRKCRRNNQIHQNTVLEMETLGETAC